jgi:hypothetical protein
MTKDKKKPYFMPLFPFSPNQTIKLFRLSFSLVQHFLTYSLNNGKGKRLLD